MARKGYGARKVPVRISHRSAWITRTVNGSMFIIAMCVLSGGVALLSIIAFNLYSQGWLPFLVYCAFLFIVASAIFGHLLELSES